MSRWRSFQIYACEGFRMHFNQLHEKIFSSRKRALWGFYRQFDFMEKYLRVAIRLWAGSKCNLTIYMKGKKIRFQIGRMRFDILCIFDFMKERFAGWKEAMWELFRHFVLMKKIFEGCTWAMWGLSLHHDFREKYLCIANWQWVGLKCNLTVLKNIFRLQIGSMRVSHALWLLERKISGLERDNVRILQTLWFDEKNIWGLK